jgi:hypothetical protein
MNYLELCQTVRREAGVSGNGPASVIGQAGEYRRITEWVADAWVDVQNVHRWLFRIADLAFDTVPGQAIYTPGDLNLTDLIDYKLTGVDDVLFLSGAPLEVLEYSYFRRHTLPRADLTGHPTLVTVDGDRALRLYPIPDAVYPARGEYWRRPQRLADNSDTPQGLDPALHRVIVYRALMLYARYEAASEIYQDAEINYQRLLAEMALVHLPSTRFSGGTLA